MALGSPSSTLRKQRRTGCFIILLALALGTFAFHRCIDKLRSPSWPGTLAQVLTADLSKRVKSGAWCVQVRYRYRLDHKVFTSSGLSLDTNVACYRDKRSAHALFGRFQPGAELPVRYDPSNPGKSIVYLDDVDISDFLMLALALLLLFTGGLLAGSSRRAS